MGNKLGVPYLPPHNKHTKSSIEGHILFCEKKVEKVSFFVFYLPPQLIVNPEAPSHVVA